MIHGVSCRKWDVPLSFLNFHAKHRPILVRSHIYSSDRSESALWVRREYKNRLKQDIVDCRSHHILWEDTSHAPTIVPAMKRKNVDACDRIITAVEPSLDSVGRTGEGKAAACARRTSTSHGRTAQF